MDLDTKLLAGLDSRIPGILDKLEATEEGKPILQRVRNLLENTKLPTDEESLDALKWFFVSLDPNLYHMYDDHSQPYKNPPSHKTFYSIVQTILDDTALKQSPTGFNFEDARHQVEAARYMINDSEKSLKVFHQMRTRESKNSHLSKVAAALSKLPPESPLYPTITEYATKVVNWPLFVGDSNPHPDIGIVHLDELIEILQKTINQDQTKFSQKQIIEAFMEKPRRHFAFFQDLSRLITEGECDSLEEAAECSSTNVSGYTILRKLGSGGSRKVFKAHDSYLDLNVSLKLYQPDAGGPQGKKLLDAIANDPTTNPFYKPDSSSENDLPDDLKMRLARERINKQEARVMARLNSQRIIRYFGSGTTMNGFPYIVEELVEGSDLAQTSSEYSEDKNVFVFNELLNAAEHLHTQEIIHRDIKPENVLVSNEGEIKLTDLQFAIRTNDTEVTAARYGAMLYAAPDAIQHQVPIDTRYDVYTLGATLYFALTQDEKAMGDINKLPKEKYDEGLAKKLEAVPTKYQPFLTKALAYNSADRQEDAGSMKAELMLEIFQESTSSGLRVAFTSCSTPYKHTIEHWFNSL